MTTPKAPSSAKIPPVQDEEEDLTIVYPSEDGEPMADNDWQYIAISDTVAALRNRYSRHTDVYVAGDMLVYYRMNDVSARTAPDVYVVFGSNGNHRRDSWLVWREGKAPDFVMEVASPRTWRRDADRKRQIYAEMGVTEYWRFDPKGTFSSRNWRASGWLKGNTGPCPSKRTIPAYFGDTAPSWGWTSASVRAWSCACTTRRPGNGCLRPPRAMMPFGLRKRKTGACWSNSTPSSLASSPRLHRSRQDTRGAQTCAPDR